MTSRLLLSRVVTSRRSPGWVTVLRSAGAHETFLRTYRGAVDAPRVVEFLLLDRLFPRSVFHALRAGRGVPGGSSTRARPPGSARSAEAIRLLGQARTDLEFLPPAELVDDLHRPAQALQTRCATSGDAVAAAVLPLGAVGGVDERGGARLNGLAARG